MWLKSYWVNDAGQVSAYICDLRNLPHDEQVHWSLYNEEPKVGIPERVIKTDFRAEWLDEDDLTPLGALVYLLDRWRWKALNGGGGSRGRSRSANGSAH